jgi:capsular exopolysaccharide synthesis family protein
MRTIELLIEEEQNYFMREAFNTLRTNILFSGKDVKTIVVTSCMAHEGKTTVSFETSKSLAESGKRVLLVDADLRKSVMVSRYTKDRGIMGLSQLLSGQVSPENAIYKTQIEGLDIIFAGPYPPNPTELVGSPAFKELLDSQRNKYDYIIVDAAPLGLVIDAAVMASVCDGAVIVINAGTIKYRVAQGVKAQLQKSGCKILGVVLNQVSRKGSSGGGYYSAKYSSEYYGYHENASAAHAQQQKNARPAVVPASGTQVRRPQAPTARPINKDQQ